MLIATHSIAKQVRLYRVDVDWPRQGFNIEHVKTIADCSPAYEDADESGLSLSLPCPEAQLYHLELVSPAPDIRSKETFAPMLLAFFCDFAHLNGHSSIGNGPSTSIARWELDSFKPALHPGFSQLPSKKSSASHPSELQVC